MKKFLAIAFALIFALSVAAPAFAVNNVCPACGKDNFATEKDYNAHIESQCPVIFGGNKTDEEKAMHCEFGCGAVFYDPAQYEIHVNETCPDRKTTWGDAVANFFLDLDYSDFKGVLDDITDALTGIGLPGIVNTIIGLLEDGVKAIIDAI